MVQLRRKGRAAPSTLVIEDWAESIFGPRQDDCMRNIRSAANFLRQASHISTLFTEVMGLSVTSLEITPGRNWSWHAV